MYSTWKKNMIYIIIMLKYYNFWCPRFHMVKVIETKNAKLLHFSIPCVKGKILSGIWELGPLVPFFFFFYQVSRCQVLVRLSKEASIFFSDDKEEDEWFQRCLLSLNLCKSGVESKVWYNLQVLLLFFLWNHPCINLYDFKIRTFFFIELFLY